MCRRDGEGAITGLSITQVDGDKVRARCRLGEKSTGNLVCSDDNVPLRLEASSDMATDKSARSKNERRDVR